LLELLSSVGIIALLLAILLPSLRSVRDQAKSVICMDHLRNSSFRFRMFADPYAHADRGQSERFGTKFFASDFLDSLYVTDEFWDLPGKSEMAYEPAQEPILCPSGPKVLSRVQGAPAHEGGITPQQNISYAMNRRLHEAPRGGRLLAVKIQERVLDYPNVPVLFDADGITSKKLRGVDDSLFAAPPQEEERSPYSTGLYWHVGLRHRGKLNIGFVGGHVISTAQPLDDPTHDWDYHPPIDRVR
jgi:prepilin-type processing-associated H-X9-DG protein